MPVQDFIDVRIVVNGQPLVEYLDPVGGPDSGPERTRYVEVKAGQQFGVQIKFLQGFKLRFAPYLFYSFTIDECTTRHYSAICTRSFRHRKGALKDDVSRVCSTTSLLHDITGDWEECPFTFGALGTTEDTTKSPNLSQEDLAKLGSIRVTVYRAKFQLRPTPYTWTGERHDAPDELPEIIMKGRALKNNVKYPYGTPCQPPGPQLEEYVPVEGDAGTKYMFKFHYRSRTILQTIGCIPRSPPPPPDPTLMLERTEDMLKLAKRREREQNLQLLRLRVELARAQSGGRSSSVVDLDGGTLTPGRSHSGTIKRDKNNEPLFGSPGFRHDPILGAGSTRPPPFLDDTTNDKGKNKRAREVEDDAGEDGVKRATKRMRGSGGLQIYDDPVLNSVKSGVPLTLGDHAVALPTQTKRKREEDDEGHEVLELPQQPKRFKPIELIDLTDD